MTPFFVQYMQSITPISFALEYGDKHYQVGNGNPQFTLCIKRELNQQELMTSTSLALGEAYMQGNLTVDRNMYDVLNLFLGSIAKFKRNDNKMKKFLFPSLSKRNQKQEVQSHYDIGNDFYRLWLDESMSYSCAYFEREADTLYEAQVGKVKHILDKLYLKPDMTLLDIGCGWGFLLIYAAKHYGIRGKGITLSKEQCEAFSKKIREEGLEDRLSVSLMDYRDLKNSGLVFDRVVSVGMLEHVGRGNYQEFMENVNAVLKDKGLFLLHYISALKEYPGDPWIKKYIFPGGVIPSLREIMDILPEYNFYTLDIESLRRHYNKTLLCWNDNFQKHREEIVKNKGEEFTRMWELYLTSCASAFYNGVVDLHQIVISKGAVNELPLHRTV